MSPEDIKAREQRASDEIARICADNSGRPWRMSIPADSGRDSDLILSDSIADIPKLVAALEAVLDMCRGDEARGYVAEPFVTAKNIRTAIATALGG